MNKMDIKIKKIDTFNCEMSISIPWMEIESDFEKFTKAFSKKIKLPGFRPGKVPKKVLMGQFLSSIEAEFIESSINKYYLNALKQEEVYPVNKGSISDVNFKYENDFLFKVSFEVEPEIKLPKMKKNLLVAEKTIYLSDKEDVSMAIEEAQRSKAEIKTIEDGSKKDDFIICDLQEIDSSGLPIIGKKLETRYIRIGQAPFDGDNQKKLTGLKLNDKTQIEVPTDEPGNKSVFELKVKNVERQILPKIDDDLVKIVDPDAKNLKDYKKRIQSRIDQSYEKKSNEILDNNIIDSLVKKINPSCPTSMIDSYLENILEDIKKNGNDQLEPEKARETYRPIAEMNIKWYLIRNVLIKDQDFNISKKEVSTEIEKLKSINNDQLKEIEKHFSITENQKKLEDSLMERKILNYLLEYTKIKEVKVLTKDLRNQAQKRV